MDDIVEDARREVEVMLTAWQTQGPGNGGIFRPRVVGVDTPRSDASSDFFNGELDQSQELPAGLRSQQSQVRFVVNDLSEGRYRDDEGMEIRKTRTSKLARSVNPGTESPRGGTSDNFEVA
jgi:putative membrane protein